MKVFKYPLHLSQGVLIADGAKILKVDWQYHGAYVWALVDPDAPMVDRRVQILATGERAPDDLGAHLGTFVTPEGFVFHAFDDPRFSND